MRPSFSPQSKRGAAMALVLVITTAMLILAAALLAAANFNIGYTSRGVQGRQAYLSAKSAVEYARAYVLAEKEGELATLTTSDTLYVIAKNGAITTDGFDVVKNAASSDLEGKAYASISLTPESVSALTTVTEEAYTLTIRGYAPQMDQKGSKTLGYQYTLTRTTTVIPPTPPTPSGNGQNGFLNAGNIAADGQSPFLMDESSYIRFPGGTDATLTYPFVSGAKVFTSVGSNPNGRLTAPQMYFLAKNGNGEAIELESVRHLVLSADFIFYNGSLLNPGGHSTITVTARDGAGSAVLYFSQSCNVSHSAINIAPGYYQIPAGENILGFSMADWDGCRISSGTDAYAAAEQSNRAGADGSKYMNSISAEDSGGWVKEGQLLTSGYGPNWGTGKRVFCYVTSAKNWSGFASSITYSSKSIYWYYVNPEDWVIPGGKEIILQADTGTDGTVTLNTMASQDEPDTHPALAAGNAQSKLYIRASKFIVPNDLTVIYYKNNVQKESYVIKAGIYTDKKFQSSGYYDKGVNLFDPDSQNSIFAKGPDEPLPDDGGGGSGGSEGDPGSIVTSAELSGGRYTDG